MQTAVKLLYSGKCMGNPIKLHTKNVIDAKKNNIIILIIIIKMNKDAYI